MKTDVALQRLLQWRTTLAADEAPPPPRAARLLELVRPWWERWPEHFRNLARELSSIEVTYGHAMVASPESGRGKPVPTLLTAHDVEEKAVANVLYFNLRDHRLTLRFELDPARQLGTAKLEATFVAPNEPRVLFAAPVARAVGNELRVDAEVPAELAKAWSSLKVTDTMPFRLILRFDGPSSDGP